MLLLESRSMREGETAQLQLDGKMGYDGTVEIHVVPGREFGSSWKGSDWTRFPARIRALATCLLHKRWLGTYRVTCSKGLLNVNCVDRAAPARNEDWTVEELALALELYFRHRKRIPSKTSVELKEFSDLLKNLNQHNGIVGDYRFRNVNGVYLKLMNFRSQDPEYTAPGRKGMPNSNSLEKILWERYVANQPALSNYCDNIRAAIGELIKLPHVDEDEDYESEEGRLFIRLHRARERNPLLAKKKKLAAQKKHNALKCEVCGFDFLKAYGKRGDGFIECHHTRPLHVMQDGERTKLQDLALLCANCHRMIHRSPWVSVSDLRKMLSEGHSPSTQIG